MKKVLYMLNYMNVGGTEKAFLNLVWTLPQDEYDITLLLLEKKGDFLAQVPNNISIKVLENYDRIKREIMDPPLYIVLDYLKKLRVYSAAGIFFTHLLFKLTGNRTDYYRFTLRGIKKRRGFDEYHAYAGPFDFISAFIAFKCIGGKKIQWNHFDVRRFGINVKTSRTLYRKMNEIRSVSDDAERSLRSLIPEIGDKSIVSRNIIAADQCRFLAEIGEGFSDEYSGIRIVTVGRISPEKGQDIIPPVASILRSKIQNFRWYLIGDGSMRERILRLIDELDLSDCVFLLGIKTNPYPFLKRADIYVQTSLHEGFCLTLSEARVFDLPVISTDCSGAHEQLDGQDNCYIVPRTVESLSEAIVKASNIVIRKKASNE